MVCLAGFFFEERNVGEILPEEVLRTLWWSCTEKARHQSVALIVEEQRGVGAHSIRGLAASSPLPASFTLPYSPHIQLLPKIHLAPELPNSPGVSAAYLMRRHRLLARVEQTQFDFLVHAAWSALASGGFCDEKIFRYWFEGRFAPGKRLQVSPKDQSSLTEEQHIINWKTEIAGAT